MMSKDLEGKYLLRSLQLLTIVLLVILIGISAATLTLVAVGTVQFNLDSFPTFFLSNIK